MTTAQHFDEVQKLAKQVAGKNDPPPPQMLKGIVMGVDTAAKTCSVQIGGSTTTITGVRWLANVFPIANDIVYLWQNGPDLFVVDKLYNLISPWNYVVAFNAGWTLYPGSAYPHYKRVGEIVFLNATLQSTAPNTVAFTLPVGYRPLDVTWFAGYSACSGYVNSAGGVVPVTATANTYGFSVSYPAAG